MPVIPTYSIVARALADTRSRTWCAAQLTILDMAIDAIADELADANPKFDTELFRVRCKHHYYRPLEETS